MTTPLMQRQNFIMRYLHQYDLIEAALVASNREHGGTPVRSDQTYCQA